MISTTMINDRSNTFSFCLLSTANPILIQNIHFITILLKTFNNHLSTFHLSTPATREFPKTMADDKTLSFLQTMWALTSANDWTRWSKRIKDFLTVNNMGSLLSREKDKPQKLSMDDETFAKKNRRMD